MNLKQTIIRLSLASVILGILGGCAVVPYQTGYRRAPPVYVESYPAYGYSGPNVYYGDGRQRYDDRGGRYYDDRRYDNRRYEEPRQRDMPLPPPLELHREIRRSLGLPRLPGMP